MEIAMRIMRYLLVADLVVAFALMVLLWFVGRGPNRRIPASALLSAFLFIVICSALIYGGLFLLLRMI